MNPAQVAAVCVSLRAGRTIAEIMAAAIVNAITAYKSGKAVKP